VLPSLIICFPNVMFISSFLQQQQFDKIEQMLNQEVEDEDEPASVAPKRRKIVRKKVVCDIN